MRRYDKEWLTELCADSYSYAEVLRKAGRKQGGGAQATLKKKIEEFGIEKERFRYEWISASEGEKFQTTMEEFHKTLTKLGPLELE